MRVYRGWLYALLQAGPEEALAWRTEGASYSRTLPDLIFPKDQSWLVSTLWDDSWRCVGGTNELVEALCAEPTIAARAVTFEEDMTPPGRTMY